MALVATRTHETDRIGSEALDPLWPLGDSVHSSTPLAGRNADSEELFLYLHFSLVSSWEHARRIKDRTFRYLLRSQEPCLVIRQLDH